MNREKLLKSPDYWLAGIQNDLYNEVEAHLETSGLKQNGLAKKLGVSPGYISQILNGNFDFKLSKFVKLCLAIGRVPHVSFKNLDEVINLETQTTNAYQINESGYLNASSISAVYSSFSSELDQVYVASPGKNVVGVVLRMSVDTEGNELRQVSSFHKRKERAAGKE